MSRTAALVLSILLLVFSASTSSPRPVDEAGQLRFAVAQPHPSGPNTGSSDGVFGAAQAETTYFGGTYWNADSLRWEALIDSVWTFDSGVGSSFDPNIPGVNPYKTPGLHTTMEGWIGIDQTFSENAKFRRLGISDFAGGTACVGDSAFGTGGGGNYSFWAGLLAEEAGQQCYFGGQGYGNNWAVCIGRTFAYDGSGSITLSYDFVIETESGFDFTSVFVDTSGIANGSDNVEVISYSGSLSGLETQFLSPGLTLPSSAANILVSFCFTADGGWSDEDGLNSTSCGAFAVDNVSLVGGGIDYFSDFETGEDGWAQLAAPGIGGEWSNIVHLADLPPYTTACECNLADSVLVFEDLSTAGHNPFQNNFAASPWIDLKAAGLVGVPDKFIQYKVYAELPLLNYVFVQVLSQYYPEPCGGRDGTSAWDNTGFVFYYGGIPTCFEGTSRLNIALGAEQVRIGIGVTIFCNFFANCTGVANSTPWFDNVRLGVTGNLSVPLLTSSGFSSGPVDAFPENGSLRINSPGRFDGPVAGSDLIGEPASDVLRVKALGDNVEVRIQFAVDPGAGHRSGCVLELAYRTPVRGNQTGTRLVLRSHEYKLYPGDHSYRPPRQICDPVSRR